MFGLLDSAADYVFGEETAEDARTHAHQMQDNAHAENQKDRDWQERMANTRYQRGRQDLEAAGFNPMLAYMNSAAPQPSGHGGVAGATPQAHGTRSNIGAAAQSAAQIDLIRAETDKVQAEADQIRTGTHPEAQARTEEIKARIPTHGQAVEESKQRVAESAVRIEKLWEETKVASATAANVEQQTKNLREMVHQIRAQVGNLNALAAQASAATDETKQRIRANLPELKRILDSLEASSRRMAQPGEASNAAAADSLMGQIGAYLRAINPLKGFISATPH